jgi:hypothetical protein
MLRRRPSLSAIGQIPPDVPAREVLEAIKQIVEVREGRRGSDALDRSVTFRDLLNLALIKERHLPRSRSGEPGKIEALAAQADLEAIHSEIRAGAALLRRNVLINGDFNIWQAGTSWTGVTSLQYAADMWLFFQGGTPGLTSAFTVERSTDVPTQAQAGRKLNYSLAVTCTTADTTVSGSDNAIIDVRVEGYDYAPLFGREQTLQFWVKSNKVGTYCVAWLDSANTEHYIAEFTVDAADTWEKKTITISGVPSVGTWDFTNGRGLRLIFGLVAGPDQQASAGAWAAGAQFATANQVNFADAVNNYFRVTDVRLVAGADASNIYIPSFAEQIRLCERYYEKSYELETVPGTATLIGTDGQRAAGTNLVYVIKFKTEKRANPSMTFYNPSSGATGTWRNHNASTDETVGVTGGGTSPVNTRSATVTIGSGDDTNLINGHWVADARL